MTQLMISTNPSKPVSICRNVHFDTRAAPPHTLSAEEYCALHAGDLLLVNSIDIGKDRVFSGWLAEG